MNMIVLSKLHVDSSHEDVAMCYYRGLLNGREGAKGQRYRLQELDHKQYLVIINATIGQQCLKIKQEVKWSL